jgi:N-acetylglucosaminyldiphosphoundecaprenol N-acetyl-beta-D-mannosaminyltransferase
MIDEPPIAVLLGLPFHNVSLEETLQECSRLMAQDKPSYMVTANLDFTTQANADTDLRKIVYYADRVVCDGMPLVWLSHLFGQPLKERVAGSDMVPRLLDICAKAGYGVYFFGSDVSTLEEAAEICAQRYPGLKVVGCDAPPIGAVVEWDNEVLCEKMRSSGAKLLLVCLGCPKQERWIFAHHQDTGVPLSIGVGASLDFITGKQKRAPKWMQKSGLEWFWRMSGNPKRLVARYAADFIFLVKATTKQLLLRGKRVLSQRISHSEEEQPKAKSDYILLKWSGSLEKGDYSQAPLPTETHIPVILDASGITFMDSGGIGHFAKLLRSCRQAGKELILQSPSDFVTHALQTVKMDALMQIAATHEEALAFVDSKAPPAEMKISQEEGFVHVTFDHPLDALHLDAATEMLEEAMGMATKGLVVNLSKVSFVDSRAVGTLIRYHKAMMARGGALYYASPKEGVREIIHMLRLDQVLSEWKGMDA